MNFLLIRDVSIIKEYLKKDDIYKEFRDNPNYELEDLFINVFSPNNWYIIYEDNIPYGILVLNQLGEHLAETHIVIYKEFRGKKAREIGKACCDFLRNNTSIKKVLGLTPANKKHVLRFAKYLGFKYIHTIKDSATASDHILTELTL